MIIFDVETTGLKASSGQICQLSYLVLDQNTVIGYNHFFTVRAVEPGAKKIHRMSAEWLKTKSNGKLFRDLAPTIFGYFSDTKKVFVGHNVEFDIEFLSKEFLRSGKGMSWQPKHTYCTMQKTTSYCKIPFENDYGYNTKRYKWPQLTELLLEIGVKESKVLQCARNIFGEAVGAHDSRFDVAAVFLALQEIQKYELIRLPKKLQTIGDYSVSPAPTYSDSPNKARSFVLQNKSSEGEVAATTQTEIKWWQFWR